MNETSGSFYRVILRMQFYQNVGIPRIIGYCDAVNATYMEERMRERKERLDEAEVREI